MLIRHEKEGKKFSVCAVKSLPWRAARRLRACRRPPSATALSTCGRRARAWSDMASVTVQKGQSASTKYTKDICYVTHLLGVGQFWVNETKWSTFTRRLHFFIAYILPYFYLFFCWVLIFGGFFSENVPKDLKPDSVLFANTYTIFLISMAIVWRNEERIKHLLYQMSSVMEELYEGNVETQMLKKLKLHLRLLTFMYTSSCISLGAGTCITYFTTAYQFKLIKKYFYDLEKIFLDVPETLTQKQKEQKYINKMIKGLKLIDGALWCVKEIEVVFEAPYTGQVMLNLYALVLLLMRMLFSQDHTALRSARGTVVMTRDSDQLALGLSRISWMSMRLFLNLV
ncbi:hypothetical protein EVAR_8768_1 [Eumeta japonica]|uniref:Odorant receptor n=1 Tax=Eumeta variegata TaxID=151549 RepID=A0A4C1TU26_EUMVA|nr:hypothetical protein EVAR_8768_1 [Eumeta japonica]